MDQRCITAWSLRCQENMTRGSIYIYIIQSSNTTKTSIGRFFLRALVQVNRFAHSGSIFTSAWVYQVEGLVPADHQQSSKEVWTMLLAAKEYKFIGLTKPQKNKNKCRPVSSVLHVWVLYTNCINILYIIYIYIYVCVCVCVCVWGGGIKKQQRLPC